MLGLPYTHLEGELHQLEAELRSGIVVPQVVARVAKAASSPSSSASRRRAQQQGGAGKAAATLALALLVLGALLFVSPPRLLLSLSSSSPHALPSKVPPVPLLLPLPGGAPNCFGNDPACARGLMRPLAAASASSSSSSSAADHDNNANDADKSLLSSVPYVIHMTVEDRARIPCQMLESMRSWRVLNPSWRLWVWDAADRRRLVAEAFPRWLRYFDALPAGVERADLFKYAVLSAIGGVYADIDVECRRPISEWASVYPRALMRQGGDGNGNNKNNTASSSPPLPKSALILGCEALHDDADTYRQAKHVYPVQLGAWTVLASPGHPALGRKGDALFPASQAEAARELLALFSPPASAPSPSGRKEEDDKPPRQQQQHLPLLRDVLGVTEGGGGDDFEDMPDAKMQDETARLWWRESILNRTGPFLLTRQALAFASDRLEPSLRLDTHLEGGRRLRNEVG
jgi:hypothetical protein